MIANLLPSMHYAQQSKPASSGFERGHAAGAKVAAVAVDSLTLIPRAVVGNGQLFLDKRVFAGPSEFKSVLLERGVLAATATVAGWGCVAIGGLAGAAVGCACGLALACVGGNTDGWVTLGAKVGFVLGCGPALLCVGLVECLRWPVAKLTEGVAYVAVNAVGCASGGVGSLLLSDGLDRRPSAAQEVQAPSAAEEAQAGAPPRVAPDTRSDALRQWLFAERYRNGGRTADALRCYEAAVELAPDNATYRVSLAQCLSSDGRPQDAVVQLTRAVDIEPTSCGRLNLLGVALGACGRHEEALERFLVAERLDGEHAQYSANIAVTLDNLERRNEATGAWSDAATKAPDCAEYHKKLGEHLREDGEYERALTSLQASVRLRPTDAATHNTLGLVLGQLERYAEATESYRAAAQHDPASATYQSNVAISLTNEGREAESLASWREAVRLAPESARMGQGLASALDVSGLHEEAIVQYDRVVALGDDNKAACAIESGRLLRQLRRYAEAATRCRAAVALEPDNVAYLDALGGALRHSGELDAAYDVRRRAAELAPADATIQMNTAITAHEAGLTEAAIGYGFAALAINDRRERTYIDLANMLVDNDENERAIDLCRQGLRIFPRCDELHEKLDDLAPQTDNTTYDNADRIDELLQAWAGEGAQLQVPDMRDVRWELTPHQLRLLNRFSEAQKSTADYLNVGTRPQLANRVLTVFQQIGRFADLRSLAFDAMEWGLDDCGDRSVLTLSQVESVLSGRAALESAEPREALLRAAQCQLAAEVAQRHAASYVQRHNSNDHAEVYLAYDLAVKQTLGLPAAANNTLFTQLASISSAERQAVIEEARQAIEPEGAQMQAHLSTWQAWQELLRTEEVRRLAYATLPMRRVSPRDVEGVRCPVLLADVAELNQPVLLTRGPPCFVEFSELCKWWVANGTHPVHSDIDLPNLDGVYKVMVSRLIQS